MGMNSMFSVIIAAAGNSGRMGRLKPFLPWDNRRSFLEKIVDEYLVSGCSQVLVVLNPAGVEELSALSVDFPGNVEVICNRAPELERMHSLRLAAEAVHEEAHCFIQNADNPFVDSKLIRAMLALLPHDFVQPFCNERGGHPVLVSPRIIQDILRSDEHHTLRDIVAPYPPRKLAVESPDVLYNINTPDDYFQYFGRHPEI